MAWDEGSQDKDRMVKVREDASHALLSEVL